MEAYITPPHRDESADPLTRLLAAILAFLRALLADHQAAQRLAAPRRATFPEICCEPCTTPRHKTRRRPVRHAPAPRHPSHARDMTSGLPRPRNVAPH